MRLRFISPFHSTVEALAALAVFCLPLPHIHAEAAAPDESEPVPFLVFESNRTGNWEIYRIGLDGSGETAITEDGASNTDAAISPGGQWIVWKRQEGRHSTLEICRADGGDQRTLLKRASWPSFSGDGLLLFAETRQDGKLTIKSAPFDEASGTVGDSQVIYETAWMLARDPSHISGTPVTGRIAFWSLRPRGTSLLYLDSGMEESIHSGCMPRMMPDGCHLVWVKRPGQFGIMRDGAIRKEADLFLMPMDEPFNHAYFPYLTPDYKWLAFAACPSDQHNHDSSNYQIFVQSFHKNQPSGRPKRLTHNSATDRNPVLWTPESAAFSNNLREAFASGQEAAERIALMVANNIPGLYGGPAADGDSRRQRNDFAWRVDFSRSPKEAFNLENGARFVEGGLEIPKGGSARSLQPLALLASAVAERGEFLAEISMSVPSRDNRSGGTIISLAEPGSGTNFLVRQDGSQVEVFHRDTREKVAEAHGARVSGKLPSDGFNHIVVTCSDGAIRLYINGRRVGAEKVRKEINAWRETTMLYIARLPNGKPTWRGQIHSITFTNNAIGSKSILRLYGAAKQRFVKAVE